jgi:hypothetical protein
MIAFTLSDLVSIFGFCSILFLFPMPIPLFPIAGALIFTASPLDGAFVGMVSGLFLGVPYMMIAAMMSYGSSR